MKSAVARLVFATAFAALVALDDSSAESLRGYTSDPNRFENEIIAFEIQDRTNPPPQNAVLCVGSSSMRGWHPWLADDLAPLTVIPRGFGGSTMNDLLHFADRVILPYRPRAILLYEGDNDAAESVSPAIIHAAFTTLTARVHRDLPDTRFYVIPAKPSIARWNLWPAIQEANNLLRETCAQDERMTYIDTASAMLLEDGTVDGLLFIPDQLHLNRQGYLLWREVVRAVLIPAESPYESD